MTIKRLCILAVVVIAIFPAVGCQKTEQTSEAAMDFTWQADQFVDLRILRYQVPGFEFLPAAQKELIYYLSEAALCGRDIIFAQNYKHNLTIRKTLDAVVEGYKGERSDPRWPKTTGRDR